MLREREKFVDVPKSESDGTVRGGPPAAPASVKRLMSVLPVLLTFFPFLSTASFEIASQLAIEALNAENTNQKT